MTHRAAVLWLVLVGAPLLPLLLAWFRRFGKKVDERSWGIPIQVGLVITTLNFVLLPCGLLWAPVLGPYYSQRRLIIIYTSMIAMIVIAVAACFGAKGQKGPLISAATILALAWAYMAVINSVV